MPVETVNLVHPLSASTIAPVKLAPCCRCGRRHDAKSCKFKEAICHKCGKLWHIAPVRRSSSPSSVDKGKKRYKPKHYHRKKAGGTKWLEEDNNPLPLFVLWGDVPQPPILICLFVNGSLVHFELKRGG